MKGLKGLKEIHDIMEKIYKEEKHLDAEERVKKLQSESNEFLRERKLSLRRVKTKSKKASVA